MSQNTEKLSVSIAGGSGYIGGELLRLLLNHPYLEVKQVSSESNAGKFIHTVHPNLRHITKMKFSKIADLESCDVLWLCLPHGLSQKNIEEYKKIAPTIFDLAADYRLSSPDLYKKFYGEEHLNPELLQKFVYGIVEVNRQKIKEASYVTGAGCLATATILGLLPFKRAGLLNNNTKIVAEAKVGSSASGNVPSLATHHAERHGVLRSFAPTGHRHIAEIKENIVGDLDLDVHFSATAVEMVRGILSTIHIIFDQPLTDKDVWAVMRESYRDEPFIRLVKERKGVFRYPEPKLLAGTNLCDIGFECDPETGRVVVMSALDNLVKGGAGNAVQALNVKMDWPETLGLEFPGLHPI